jgi:hypothetical protein
MRIRRSGVSQPAGISRGTSSCSHLCSPALRSAQTHLDAYRSRHLVRVAPWTLMDARIPVRFLWQSGGSKVQVRPARLNEIRSAASFA